MHFAYPPRKTSNPPHYLPRSKKSSSPSSSLNGLLGGLQRRQGLKKIALVGLAVITFFYLISSWTSGGSKRGYAGRPYNPKKPSGKPPAVLVTVFDKDKKYSKAYIDTVKENRVQYAAKHGYKTFFAQASDYDLRGAPNSWTKVVAARHAMTEFPDASFIWYLDQDSFVMNPSLKIEDHVMAPKRLESLMIKDHPVVPPDSIIKTFNHLKGGDVDFVLTQDNEGLSAGSFVLRNGEWAKFFLETWFDPIYRSYNFQKAETHALEHIVQWHPTILSKLALVDQRTINSYSKSESGQEYKDGDIAVRFVDCEKLGIQACENESQKFAQQWRVSFKNS
ncbi:glycosyltransferase family 34 protein [Diplogelasinospora grovesii]|uniref:Glycosyltransferase family 34 protein n=1 Tax=Diplogelasinospora grovesii TaxID=303347 RepID=A0AAN6NKA6_9PEZI|nr:glycosyltransferase family 34 protein [Diplogelasinospora grovesii]